MEHKIVQNLGRCPKLPWMIEFHSTADGKIMNHQLKAAFAENFLEHMSKLHEKSKVRRKRLTQFSVVIPPGLSVEHVEDFLKAGMTVAMIKIDYFNINELQDVIDLVNKVNEEFGRKIGRVYPLAIALEASEPEIFTGKLLPPLKEVQLKKGQTAKVFSDPQYANRMNQECIYINYDKISDVVKPGDSIILGDEIHMSAYEIVRDVINCIIDRAGLLTDNLSVKIPNVPIKIPDTESFAKLQAIHEIREVDMVFVGPAKLDSAKEIFGPTVLIFLKVEYASTVEQFDELIEKADGVLIDGEKLITTTKENVFIIQKSIIAKCNKLGKPVVAFISCHSLTKAQVNDIANTVIDGIDGLLLPPDKQLLESISMICKSAEGAIYQKQLFSNLVQIRPPPIEPIISIAVSAVETSFNCNAAAIILLTTTGRSAKLISSYKPRCPIIALTRFGRVAKQLMIYKAVLPIYYVKRGSDTFEENVEKSMQIGMTFGKVNGYIKMGDAVVIVFGTNTKVGFRNCMEVVFASEYDTVEEEKIQGY